MKGQILDYSVQSHTGVISGADGSRYTFTGAEWKSDRTLVRGMAVDFEVRDTTASAIYPALTAGGSSVLPGAKNNLVAGLLAIFLGSLGIHKFYLGYTGAGMVYLITNTIGFIVTIFMLGIPNFILAVIALIEGIIYITKSEQEFEQTYVVGNRPWF